MTASQCILGNDHYLLETARMSFEEILPRNKMSNVANNQALVPDNFLYHYTSLTGLQGIVNSGVIWATNIFYLNDSKELLNAVDVARWSFEHLSEHYSLSKEELEFLSQIEGASHLKGWFIPFSGIKPEIRQSHQTKCDALL